MTWTLHLGDCLEYLRTLPSGSVDAVVTDPPYGIARVWKGGGGHGWGKAHAQTQHRNEWDVTSPTLEVFEAILALGVPTVIWGGNYFSLPISRGWLVWNKPERNFSLAEAELAWTNKDAVMRVFDCRRSDPGRQHPTQKPVKLMEWCLERLGVPVGGTVLDPFAGSGTTGVAAIRMGRNFIGCEISPEYHAIATRRLKEAEAADGLFAQSTTCPQTQPAK